MAIMRRPNLFLRALLLLTTAESHVLIQDSHCTKSDGTEGVCKTDDGCPELKGNTNRRRSRRFSCYSESLICCPFRGGRRRSSVQKVVYTKPKNTEQCPASARPPDPKSGCCGKEVDVANRIVGGTATELDQFPWMALLEYTDQRGQRTAHMCGGSLISARYVLTAAHCVTGARRDSAEPTAVTLAEYDRNNSTDCLDAEGGGVDCIKATTIKIESVRLHPKRDMALVRLAEPAPYTDFIRPICLPSEDISDSPPQGLVFTVSGWGLTDSHPPRPSRVKRHTQIPFVAQDQCQERYRNTRRLHSDEKQICAGGDTGKDSCSGDSGGPLMYDDGERVQLSGIISFGSTHCGNGGTPAVHVNVHANKQWILDNITD